MNDKRFICLVLVLLSAAALLGGCTPATQERLTPTLDLVEPASIPVFATATIVPTVAESAPTIAADAYLGGWQVVDTNPGPVNALPYEQAHARLGLTAWMAADSIYFDNSICLNPNYTTAQSSLAEVLSGFKATPENIKLSDQPVTKIHTDCVSPGLDDFFMLDGQTILLQRDGWFYILHPQMDGSAVEGVPLSPVADRQSGKNPNIDLYIVRPHSGRASVDQVITAVIQQQVDGFLSDMSTWETPAEFKDAASEFDINYQIMQNGDGKLSLLFTRFNYYAGSAHPSTVYFTLNYDLNTDQEIELADLFAPGADYLTRLADESRSQLSSPDLMVFEDALQPTAETFVHWNLRGENLVLDFDQGQVAPNAVGTLQATIPFARLQDILHKP
jgi:hypothetical protein